MPQPVVTFVLPKRSALCETCKAPGVLRKYPTEDFWVQLDFSAELGEDTIDSVAEATDGGTGVLSEDDPPQGSGTSAWVMVNDGATASRGAIRVDVLTTEGNRISGVVDFQILQDPTQEYGVDVPASALSNYYTIAQTNARIGDHRVVDPATGTFQWNTSEGSVLILFLTGDLELTINNDASRMSLAIIAIQDGVGGHALDLHTQNTVLTRDGSALTLTATADASDVITMIGDHLGAWYVLFADDFTEVT